MKRNTIGLSLVLLAAGLTLSCRNTTNPAATTPPPVSVGVYQVKAEPATHYKLYPGNVEALQEVQLRAQVHGYLTGIFFREGQTVRRGQKLYEIDRALYEATLQEARAQVAIAQTRVDKAQQDNDRYLRLLSQDAIARQTVEYAQNDLQTAKSQLQAALANQVKAQKNLEYAVIRAPFTGTIGLSQVKTGALVVPGETLLNTVSVDDPIAVDFALDEKEIGRFEQLRREDQPEAFSILLPDQSLYAHPGRLHTIDRAVDRQTGTLQVRLSFPNPDRTLKAGMSSNIRLLTGPGRKELLIPAKALIEQMGEHFVFVAAENKAIQRKIRIGSRVADKVIVESGLTAGERVITEGLQRLRDGAPIAAVPAPGPASVARN